MAEPLYAADPPEALRCAALDGLTVLYHRPSGQTHIVSEPVPEILDALQAGPCSAAELLARLTGSEDGGGREALTARLEELEATGLVFRA